jgi:hypothetical protein
MKSFFMKSALCCTVLLSLVWPGSALELSAGGRVGLNVSSLFGDSVKAMNPRVGFNLGLFAEEWLSERIGLQQDLILGTRGARWKSGQVDYLAYDNFATVFTFLDIPLLVKWCFKKNDAARPALYFGPDFAFPLTAESVFEGTAKDMKKETQAFDFGLTVGASLDVRQGDAFIPIDIRYTLGLTNYAKSGEYNAHVTHGVFSISAGLGHLINLKKDKKKDF